MPTGNRLLAVDDNPMNLSIFQEIFELGFQLQVAHGGDEALQIAPAFIPDVVLLDVRMPRPDGYEVCRRLKSEHGLWQTRIIMVSSNADLDERLRGYAAGADDYVPRPFDEAELAAKVQANLRSQSGLDMLQQQIHAICGATGEALELVSHLRDAETGEHLDRIRAYSQLLASELRHTDANQEIDDIFIEDLGRASPLHDIGKVGIPDALLRKPGPLTTVEREQMQQHTVIGERILKQLSQRSGARFFQMATEVARWHHERHDGAGYPDGLRGDEIPLAARIVRVADVFDALTSVRVYKPSWSPEAARHQIACTDRAGFDPRVVQAMLRIFDQFEDICRAPVAAISNMCVPTSY